jgi:adenylate cyclase
MKKTLSQLIIITGMTILAMCGVKTSAPKEGQEKIDSLFAVLKTTKADASKVIILNSLANEFRNDNPDTAFCFANEALALSTRLNDTSGIADALLYMGIASYNLGKYEQAFTNASKALRLYDQLLTSEKITGKLIILKQKGRVYTIIGYIYNNQFKYPESLKNHLAALKIRKEIGDESDIAMSYNNIGVNYIYLGNYPEALKNFFGTLKIYEAIGDKKGIADVYNNIGSIYSGQGNYPVALKIFFTALKIQKEIGNKQGISTIYNNIGNIYYHQVSYPDALKNYFAALKIFEEIGDKSDAAGVYGNIGCIYMTLGQSHYSEALKNLVTALIIHQETGNNQGIAISYDNLGNMYTKLKKYSIASHYLNEGLLLAKDIGSLEIIQNSYNLLSTLDSTQGNYKQALEHYKLYIIYRDSLHNDDNTNKLVQTQMRYEFDIKEAVAKAEQDKKDVVAEAELQQQKILRNSFIGGFAIVLAFASVFFMQRNRIRKEKKRSDELLLNILPAAVAEELKAKGSAEAQLIDEVTVLFTDFKGFTAMSEKLTPKELVRDIHECFSAFDHIIDKYGIEKIKTIGDSYMAAGGLPIPNKTHAADAINAALEIIQFIAEGKARKIAGGAPYFEIRIGVHTGPVVAGIVGVKKFAYDIWGDTVNIASRMESSGEAGKINISGSTYAKVKDKYNCTYRGKIEAKNKGLIDMYFVDSISLKG